MSGKIEELLTVADLNEKFRKLHRSPSTQSVSLTFPNFIQPVTGVWTHIFRSKQCADP